MAIIKVTNTADSGKGSLRAALDSAQAGDTIQFDSSLANKTITLTSGELAITKDITIDGAGAENLTISGNNATRVFSVWKYTDATVKNLISTMVWQLVKTQTSEAAVLQSGTTAL